MIKGETCESHEMFQHRIMEVCTRLAEELQPLSLKFTITGKATPRLAVIPFRKTKMAAISIRKRDNKPVDSLISMSGFYGAYRVQEAIPVCYVKDWKNCEPTPGVCLLTLFLRKQGLDFATFIDRWHNSHTPLSLRVHPLWNYVRNVVEERLTAGSAPFEGIVEEHFRTAADLLNPFRFFGNPLVIINRMLLVYKDTRTFIDYRTMETYLTTEYHIVS